MLKKRDILVFTANCTWGIIQSVAGLIVFLYFIDKPHYRYKGSIVTVNAKPRFLPLKSGYGFSLGIFIFLSCALEKEQAADDNTLKHEYGHCLQSVLLGPLDLFVIEIPSAVWFHFFENWRKKHNKNYGWFYPESWADKWGKAK